MSAKKPLAFDINASPRTPAEKIPLAKDARKQIGARVEAETYRQLKARAAMQGATVEQLLGQAITEFLTNHPM